MKNQKKISIANAGGFWGDHFSALKNQITLGKINYLTLDYLAEDTMFQLLKKGI